MIKEIIVVEGKDDTTAIKRAVDAETIETGGSAINSDIIKRISLAQERRGVIIFTDPDHAGERIRKIISSRVKGCKHAFITQEDAHKRGDIGVENASPAAIRKALDNVKTEFGGVAAQITWEHLMDAGLIVHADAANRRMKMGKLLGIGYCNGKQFFKRCNAFQITIEEFVAAFSRMELEQKAGSE
ncbi:DNA primase [Paenibacillus swuensis]|uniref:Ribonuclease M5 n=1 Tax=Paenibacillus swuensis TaxID=1178515 RepID=A0A172TNX9_9BACL|nr:ribonuclease M5 [Paenibacillus swuensis]ANE48765.1 DNA primase [Paenibacillus swuensis]